jgi:hypothetical protein
MPKGEPYFAIRNRYWKRPANWLELCEGIRWAAGGPLPMEIVGPPSLAVNLVSQIGQRRLIVHLVNYAARQKGTDPSAEIKVLLPAGVAIQSVQLLTPDPQNVVSPAFCQDGRMVSFQIPTIKTYTLAVVTW